MATPRREQLDERVARQLREERARAIRAAAAPVGNKLISAYLEFESWFNGDPPGTHPEPELDHQPAISEPWLNTSGDDGVWDAGDPYWLRIPEPGVYRVTVEHSSIISLDLSGTGGDGYNGVQVDTYAEAWRSNLPAGEDPTGRDDPFFGPPPSIWSGFTVAYDQHFLPPRHDTYSLGYDFSGPLVELSDIDSLRVIFRYNTLDPLDPSDGWFNAFFQGAVSLERVGDSPA